MSEVGTRASGPGDRVDAGAFGDGATTVVHSGGNTTPILPIPAHGHPVTLSLLFLLATSRSQ